MAKPAPVVVTMTRLQGKPARCAECQVCRMSLTHALQGDKPSAVIADLLSLLRESCPKAAEVGRHFVSAAPVGVTLSFVHRPGTDGEKEIECWASGTQLICVTGPVAKTMPVLVRYTLPRYEGAAQEFVKTLSHWGCSGRVVRDAEVPR